MRERMSWDELVKAYPDSWVILDNVVFTDAEHCMFVESGEFVENVNEEIVGDKWATLSNSVIVYTGDRRIRAITSPCKRMSWSDIEKEFPDMWVVLKDEKHVDDDDMNINVVSGIVMCSASDYQIDEFWAAVKHYKLGYYVNRTSDDYPFAFIGVTL